MRRERDREECGLERHSANKWILRPIINEHMFTLAGIFVLRNIFVKPFQRVCVCWPTSWVKEYMGNYVRKCCFSQQISSISCVLPTR